MKIAPFEFYGSPIGRRVLRFNGMGLLYEESDVIAKYWIRPPFGSASQPRLIFYLAWLLALIIIPTAHAKPVAARDLTELSIEDLLSMEVTTVSRKAQRLSDSAAAVFVITNEEIRRSGVTSIPEALRMVPGLEVARISSNSWAVTARGFNGQFANKLLVLMDGRSVYTPLYSGVFWNVQDTMLEDVARIEVIRGPGASLWGANAVNGVINIITKPASETQGGLATGGFGNEEKGFGALRYGGKIGDSAHYRAYGKYFDRDDSESLQGGDAHDGWDIARGGGRIDWRLSERDELTVQGDYYDGEVGNEGTFYSLTPPYVTPLIESSPVSGGNIIGRWQRRISPTSDLSLQAYVDRTEWEIPLVKETRDTVDVDFQHRFALGNRQEIIWGLGYRWSRGAVDTEEVASFDDEDRRDQLFSLFVQDDISLLPDRLSLMIGSKFEHNDYTGFEVQPNIRLLWQADDRNTFWSAVSRAVRTPGMVEKDVQVTQMVIPGTPVTEIVLQGDEDYRSETVIAYEAGYRWKAHDRFSTDLALFYNQYDHLRTMEPGTPYFGGIPPHVIVPVAVDNLMEGYTYGLELAVDCFPLDGWRLQGAYTYLKMHLESKEGSLDTVSVMADGDIPRHQVSLRSTLDLPKGFELDLWLRYVDELPAQSLSDYWNVDARIGWRPTPSWEFSVAGQNLFESSRKEFNPEVYDLASTEIERSYYFKAAWHF